MSLVPRELLLQVSRPMTEMTDEQLQQQALAEQEASQRLIEHIRLRGGEELIEQARREVLGNTDGDEEESDE
jgi:hypothetical protein